MKTFEELQKLSKSDFDIEIAKIEKARKEYLKSDEYTEILRDKGEQIMRILIEDNQKSAMNLGCSIGIIDRIKDSNFKSPRSKEDQYRLAKDYEAGKETLKVMKQVKDLFSKINKVYYS